MKTFFHYIFVSCFFLVENMSEENILSMSKIIKLNKLTVKATFETEQCHIYKRDKENNCLQ